MKHSIEHLSEHKQNELKKIVSIIRKAAKVEFIILFGSYSRGDWIEDSYLKDSVVYEYKSDYDILVVVSDQETEEALSSVWQKIDSQIEREKSIKTIVSIITENIDFLNEKFSQDSYFYMDIKKDGIMLYNSNRFKLADKKKLTSGKIKEIAKENLQYWNKKGNEFLRSYQDDIKDRRWSLAAFHLHQAVESYCASALLVFTGYKPKTHNLKKLLHKVIGIHLSIQTIFPGANEEDKYLFKLLHRAYIDARYEKRYKIKKSELQKIFSKASKFSRIIKRICREKLMEDHF